MDVTIQQLRMLREVSRQGTIASAASTLGYTASAVSQQLSAVERTAGIAVLERVGRNVLLTDAGRELVFHADLVLEQMDQAQAAIERVQGQVAGTLRIGFIESVSSTMLGPIMKRMAEDFPDLALRTRDIAGSNPYELMQSGDLDVSFVIDYPSAPLSRPKNFEQVLVCRDWLRVVLPASRYASTKAPKVVDVATLANDAFIGPPIADACGKAITQTCRDAGFEPDIVHQVSDYPTTLRLIAAGAGVAIIPDLGLHRLPDGVVVANMAKPHCRSVELAFRSASAARPAVEAFIATVEATADELKLDRD